MTDHSQLITWDDFERVDLRIGQIVAIEDFPRARNPSYKLQIDFGPEIGLRWSSAQTAHYDRAELIGLRVICVVNFPPKNIAGFQSECLVCGVPGVDGRVSLLTVTRDAPLGGKVY